MEPRTHNVFGTAFTTSVFAHNVSQPLHPVDDSVGICTIAGPVDHRRPPLAFGSPEPRIVEQTIKLIYIESKPASKIHATALQIRLKRRQSHYARVLMVVLARCKIRFFVEKR